MVKRMTVSLLLSVTPSGSEDAHSFLTIESDSLM